MQEPELRWAGTMVHTLWNHGFWLHKNTVGLNLSIDYTLQDSHQDWIRSFSGVESRIQILVNPNSIRIANIDVKSNLALSP